MCYNRREESRKVPADTAGHPPAPYLLILQKCERWRFSPQTRWAVICLFVGTPSRKEAGSQSQIRSIKHLVTPLSSSSAEEAPGTSEQCPGSPAVLAAPHLAAQPASLGHHPAECPFLKADVNWIISSIVVTPGKARWAFDLLGLVSLNIPTHGGDWKKMIFRFLPTQVVLWSSFSHSGRGIY